MKIKYRFFMSPEHDYQGSEEHGLHYYDESVVGLDKMFMDVEEVMYNPPKTWEKYADSPSKHADIIQMEIIDMQNAHSAMKMSTGSHSEYIRELRHVAAAVLSALHDMSCKYQD